MAKIRKHLTHAPIVEALIDLQLDPESNELVSVQKMAENIVGYEVKNPIFVFTTTLNVDDEDGATNLTKSQELGVRLHSDDEKYVLQLRTNGFTLSRLSPYENWTNLRDEARKLWGIYVEQEKPERIRRVATRYINKLELPMQPNEEFGEYLTKPPELAEELPQGLLSFSQYFAIAHPQTGAQVNLIQALPKGVTTEPGKVPVMLDIDVYKQVSLAPEGDDVWNLLEELRVFKNEVFFASLTEKTVELFE